ncbi:MAG: hypothetical protein GTN81_13500 [Proteobacteria bacterium]|nr:hypothetical protein [Pseudomonadota bacterium]
MENLGQILEVFPSGIARIVLLSVFFSGVVLWFLVPFMIYSICYRIKTIEWNMNYILSGDKKRSTRNIKGNWRDSLLYWAIAIVEERQKERIRQRERKIERVLPVGQRGR